MRIAVTGPQNTGKTTFIEDFLKEFKNYSTPLGTYRDVVSQNNLEINQKTSEHAQNLILIFLYNLILEEVGDNIIFDRCVVDNFVYTYYAYQKGNISRDFMIKTRTKMYESIKHLDALIFIPTAAGISLVDDEMRDIDTDFIDSVNKIFLETLFDIKGRYAIPVFVVTGSRAERVRQMREILE